MKKIKVAKRLLKVEKILAIIVIPFAALACVVGGLLGVLSSMSLPEWLAQIVTVLVNFAPFVLGGAGGLLLFAVTDLVLASIAKHKLAKAKNKRQAIPGAVCAIIGFGFLGFGFAAAMIVFCSKDEDYLKAPKEPAVKEVKEVKKVVKTPAKKTTKKSK